MNKDVIYIDVDDDVTAVIGKIKSAKEKIVAIVPPKRAGSLQSAVNLRLLDRMAKADNKKLVLITNNQALIALAANASIPVAKNLQSKPEIATVVATPIDSSEDIIDGADIPVGDHAATVPVRDGNREAMRSDAIDTIDIDGVKTSVGASSALGAKKAAAKSKIKIPNFDTFRKKLFLGIAVGVGLVVLLIWMFVFAPAATVIVTARTSPAPVSAAVTLTAAGATDAEKGIIASAMQQEKRQETIEFTATGTGKVGDKATGTMTISRTSVSSTPISVPAGTRFTANGLSFLSTESASLAGTTIGPEGVIQDSATVGVQAEAVGAEYNLTARSYQSSVGGYSSQGSNMTGGTSREVKVVSAEDIERAQGDLIGRSTDEQKKAVAATFSNNEKVIDSSFTITRAAAVSTPAVNAEAADGKAVLTIETIYTMYAIPKVDLDVFLTKSIEEQLIGDTQRVYDNGSKNVGLSNFQKEGENLTASLTAIGRIGPKVDEAALKERVKGQIFGEVQASLEAIDGIKEVDVKFSYFWVRTVPNDVNKIDIEFKVENE